MIENRTVSCSNHPFNRTTLELKSVDISLDEGRSWTFNRTTLELKLEMAERCSWQQMAFNRTTLELKFAGKVGSK